MKREYLPLEALPAWVILNGITLDSISFRRFKSESDGADKGAAVVASAERSSNEAGNSDGALTLIRVPWDMILSLDGVGTYAKSDWHLREVLEAVNDFGKVCTCRTLISSILICFWPPMIITQFNLMYTDSQRRDINLPPYPTHVRQS